ncbi:MAG: hypothetical protein JWN48_3681 [Myxococcaceae bacterium]|nr:hypothetical protein [Myxococcaceae bacterium]
MVYVVALLYYRESFALVQRELRKLEHALADSGLRVYVQLVINRAELNPSDLSYPYVTHDNTGLEFGGYQRGLSELESRLTDDDTVLFLNDTFCTHHYVSRVVQRRLVAALLRARAAKVPLVAGNLDRASHSFRVDGVLMERWVSTWMFALNAAALRALELKLYCPERDQDIVGGSSLKTFFGPACEPYLRAYIAGWLFYDDGASDRWYKAAPLSEANAEMMAAKARAIVQEKYLYARLERVSTVFCSLYPSGLAQRLAHIVQRESVAAARRLVRACKAEPAPSYELPRGRRFEFK